MIVSVKCPFCGVVTNTTSPTDRTSHYRARFGTMQCEVHNPASPEAGEFWAMLAEAWQTPFVRACLQQA